MTNFTNTLTTIPFERKRIDLPHTRAIKTLFTLTESGLESARDGMGYLTLVVTTTHNKDTKALQSWCSRWEYFDRGVSVTVRDFVQTPVPTVRSVPVARYSASKLADAHAEHLLHVENHLPELFAWTLLAKRSR